MGKLIPFVEDAESIEIFAVTFVETALCDGPRHRNKRADGARLSTRDVRRANTSKALSLPDRLM